MKNADYVNFTKQAFALSETVTIATLIAKGASLDEVKQQVLDHDVLQLRSRSSREGALRTILRRFNNVSKDYIDLLASDNPDLRRFTLLFLLLQENRLMRELIAEVLIEKLNQLDPIAKGTEIRSFFETKREQEPVVAQWSASTFERTAQNTVMALVRAGLLSPIQPKGDYEIRSMPVPSPLRQQLILDGFEAYLALMLN
jgi:hypothetical protein